MQGRFLVSMNIAIRWMLLLMVGVSVVLSGCQSTPSAVGDADPGVDFTAFATFALMPVPLDAPISDPPIGPSTLNEMNALMRQRLMAMGYREAGRDSADLQVTLRGHILSKLETIDWGYGVDRWRSPYRGLSRFEVDSSNKGTLIVDIVQRDEQKLVWRGWSRRDINGYYPENEALLRALTAILNTLPGTGDTPSSSQ